MACIGHGKESFINATAEQMKEVSYVHSGANTIKSVEGLAHESVGWQSSRVRESKIFVGGGNSLQHSNTLFA